MVNSEKEIEDVTIWIIYNGKYGDEILIIFLIIYVMIIFKAK